MSSTLAAGFLGLLFAAWPACTRAAAPVIPPADEVALLQARLSPDLPASEDPDRRLKAAMELAAHGGCTSNLTAGGAPPVNFVQPMINFGDAQYVSYFKMGKQMIAGLLDTGSFELVVFGSDCYSCRAAAHYSHYLSETFEQGTLATQHNYGSGGVVSHEGFEEVSIGPFCPARQMFWEVVEARMPVLQNAAFEAIVGMGPPEAALAEVWSEADQYIKNLTSYYDQAMLAPQDEVLTTQDMVKIALQLGHELPLLHTWNAKQFSVCMGGAANSDGVIVWNDTLPFEHPELFQKVPVSGEQHHHTWSAMLTEPTLEGGSGNQTSLGCSANSGCKALLDTGTSLLGAPTAVINKMLHVMEEVLDPECSNLDALPDLTFQLGGKNFSLPPSAYVAKFTGAISERLEDHLPSRREKSRRTGVACDLAVIDTGSTFQMGDMWILGIPFFRKFYTSFYLGNSIEERAFHIAPHGDQECTPVSPTDLAMTGQRSRQKLREIEASRLKLPGPQSFGSGKRRWTRRSA